MGKSFRGRGSFSTYLKVTVYWGDVLYDTILCLPGDEISVGSNQKNDLVIPLEGKFNKDTIKVIQVLDDNSVELRFDDGIEGHVYLGEKFCRLSAAIEQGLAQRELDGNHVIRLNTNDRANLVIGHLTFDLSWGTDKVILSRASSEDRMRALRIGAMMTVLSLGLLTGLHFYRPEILEPERVVELLVKPPPPPPPKAKAAIGETKTADGGASKEEVGKAKVVEKPKLSEAEKLRQSLSGDVVKELAELGTVAPDVNARSKPDDAVAAALDQASTGGASTEGLGKGAGGKSVGIGRTVGQGEGGFGGTGRLGLSGNSAVEGGTGLGGYETRTEGGLDRDVIDAIVRKRKDRIRLCYERQLNFNPGLAGKVTVHFVIGATGQVVKASLIEDTMKNGAVNACILDEVKDWKFPAPKGGTTVNVDYPFVFDSSVK